MAISDGNNEACSMRWPYCDVGGRELRDWTGRRHRKSEERNVREQVEQHRSRPSGALQRLRRHRLARRPTRTSVCDRPPLVERAAPAPVSPDTFESRPRTDNASHRVDGVTDLWRLRRAAALPLSIPPPRCRRGRDAPRWRACCHWMSRAATGALSDVLSSRVSPRRPGLHRIASRVLPAPAIPPVRARIICPPARSRREVGRPGHRPSRPHGGAILGDRGPHAGPRQPIPGRVHPVDGHARSPRRSVALPRTKPIRSARPPSSATIIVENRGRGPVYV